MVAEPFKVTPLVGEIVNVPAPLFITFNSVLSTG
jgi:hypothetical protein